MAILKPLVSRNQSPSVVDPALERGKRPLARFAAGKKRKKEKDLGVAVEEKDGQGETDSLAAESRFDM